jgi:hypothetical protein
LLLNQTFVKVHVNKSLVNLWWIKWTLKSELTGCPRIQKRIHTVSILFLWVNVTWI